MAENPNTALAVQGEEKLRAIMRKPDTIARFAEVLGQHNAPAYVTSVLLAVANNDQLQQCSPASIISSAMRAATLRLSCDPATKQAHLTPFKGKATLVVGYKGYYDMAVRTNRYRILNDFKVYEGQEFVEDQLRGTIEIKGYKASDTVIGYGFFFEMLNGLKKALYMTVEEIHAHGARYSKTYNFQNSVWKTDFEAMARKTVIRLCLSRYGYLDPTDALNLSASDESEGEDVELVQIPERPRRSINENLTALGFDPEPEREPIRATAEGELIEGDFSEEKQEDDAPGQPSLLNEQPAAPKPASTEKPGKHTPETVKAYKALEEQAQDLGLKVAPINYAVITASELAASTEELRARVIEAEKRIGGNG